MKKGALQQKTLRIIMKKRRVGRAAALLFLFLLSPAANVFYSMAVMSVYSKMNEADSLMATEGITLSIPGGLATLRSDWYPFVMTFCADSGFRHFTRDTSLSLTILYNFPAFSPLKGCSRLYDTDSPYYNSFYGAYLVKDADGTPYGFIENADGTLFPDSEAAAKVPMYDFWELVLAEFGLTSANAVFDWNVTELTGGQMYADQNDFFRIDAELTVNGVSHKENGFTQSYLQYGRPNFPVKKALAPVSMYGRLYGKYLKEKQVSLFFYIVAADKEVLEECDRELLSQSTLRY